MQPVLLRVFVSSTWLDLQPERQVVEAALQWLCETKFVGMEPFSSWSVGTHRASLEEVDRADVDLSLFSGHSGSGLTEAEYCWAW